VLELEAICPPGLNVRYRGSNFGVVARGTDNIITVTGDGLEGAFIDFDKYTVVSVYGGATEYGVSGKVKITQLSDTEYSLSVSSDIFGVEMYGAIKNVIAIAGGIIDGMGYPESTKCMFITKSLNDIVDLIYEMGGNKKTILTYAGIGDLLLTWNSLKSRYYSFGKMIGEGKDKKIIDEYVENTTIEGLYTLKSIYDLIHRKKIKMPIINIIYDIVYNHKDTKLLEDYLRK
jgi:glycerol-3-phosphate dehydrogenase (NAD(P)+)